MLLYGGTEAAAYLRNSDARITGYVFEKTAGKVFATLFMMFCVCLATVMLRERMPISKEQSWAMQPIDWSVLATSLILGLNAAAFLSLNSALNWCTTNKWAVCLSSHLISTLLVVLLLLLVTFSTIENVKRINYAGVQRMQCSEYKVGIVFMALLTPLGPLSVYRFSTLPWGNTCVVFLPRDVLIPLLVANLFLNVYAALRICWPLSRTKHERMRAWTIRTMIGVLLCANCASLASIVLLMTSAAYIYYTAVLCLLLTAMAFASLTAFIMTLNPPYKRLHTTPPSTPDTEAHIPADESLCHNCLGRQRPFDNGTPVNSPASRMLSSYYSPSGHKQKAFSILDSKSVAEFLFDEDHSLAAPAFPKTILSVDGTSEGSHDMIPLHMVNWSCLRASESEQVSSGGLSPRLKAPAQSHLSTATRFVRPKTSTFDYETKELGIELPGSTIGSSDVSCMTALDSTNRDSLPTRQGTGVHLNNSIQGASGCTLQQPLAHSGARLLPFQGEPSPAVRAAFLDALAVRRPTSVRSRTSEAFMDVP